jgi:hypothetical protein
MLLKIILRSSANSLAVNSCSFDGPIHRKSADCRSWMDRHSRDGACRGADVHSWFRAARFFRRALPIPLPMSLAVVSFCAAAIFKATCPKRVISGHSRLCDVRFTPKSGSRRATVRSPLSANRRPRASYLRSGNQGSIRSQTATMMRV